MTGESRKKFDTFFRTLVSGSDAENPKPKSIKLTKVQPISLTTFGVACSPYLNSVLLFNCDSSC